MTHVASTGPLRLSTPPEISARPTNRTIHGIEILDDFAWIRADNWRDVLRDPTTLPGEIRDLLERENAYAATVMAPTAALQKRLVKEMRDRMEDEDAEVPVPDGPFEYYTRFREDGQHELFCRIPRGGGPETILLDGDALAKGHEFYEFGDCEPTARHDLLAWTADDKGSELYTIKVRDLETGRDRADTVTRADGSVVWTADSAAFFYVRVDDNHRASSVWLHRLGTHHHEDRAVYDEADPTWFVSVGRSRSGRFAIISIHGHDAAEARVVPLDEPEAEPRLIVARSPGLRYELDHRDDRFIILTNADGAVDFKIVEAPVETPGPEMWRDLVVHRPGRLIVGSAAFARHLVRLEQENCLPQIVIRTFETGVETAVSFPEEAYALGLEEVVEQDTDVMRFSYSSMTTPEEVYDYDMRTGVRTLRKRQEVPSGHDPASYVTRRIFAKAPDGAEVPVSVLHRRGLVLDGSAPLLLYGYGAYGYAIPAAFGTKRLSLVDRGFVYAVAHVRGGTDKGWPGIRTGSSPGRPIRSAISSRPGVPWFRRGSRPRDASSRRAAVPEAC